MSMKRKAAGHAALEIPDSKRRKGTSATDDEAPETTSVAGLKLINTIKEARDKKNHLISTEFLTLPDKHEIPEYYEDIALPLAIDTIEGKLQRREYPTLSTVESDLKRMVQNAKQFNEKTSEIHADAEKIRKMVGNHMSKINPAYKDPNYQPFPTPIPDVATGSSTVKNEAKRSNGIAADAGGDEKKRPALTLHGPRSGKEVSRRRDSTPAVQETESTSNVFKGKSFQQAQEKIVDEMMDLTSVDGTSISGPFVNLPTRELKDYYQVIKQPLSLKGVQKRVRGVKGRDKPTGISLYKSWQSFADDMALIWENARSYNEDGSEISELAGELKEHFESILAKAKAVVSEPQQPKVTLRLGARESEPPAKVKLHLTAKNPSTENNGIGIDPESLKRQQELVTAGANGQRSSIPTASPATETGQVNGTGSPRPVTANGINESQPSDSPASQIALARSASNDALKSGSMPPPSGVTPRITSGSPHPQIIHKPAPTPVDPLENRFRAPDKTAADALITNLTISSHPMMKLTNAFRLSIPPSTVLTQQSVTVTVPSNWSWVRVEPIFSTSILQRQYKYFVTCNQVNIQPMSKRPDADEPRPAFDVRIHAGINIVEIEIITAPPRGAPKVGSGSDVEFEKTTVYVNVLQS